jgi:hypothetical protein
MRIKKQLRDTIEELLCLIEEEFPTEPDTQGLLADSLLKVAVWESILEQATWNVDDAITKKLTEV